MIQKKRDHTGRAPPEGVGGLSHKPCKGLVQRSDTEKWVSVLPGGLLGLTGGPWMDAIHEEPQYMPAYS